MPLVSVIVPVYNVERYLERCLDSIVNQTYRNLEIILVNDGSSDGSGSICRRYAEQDKRVRLYCQENRGQSAARNVGLDHMSGAYLTFVDADDYISLSFVEILLKKIRDCKVPLAVCGYDTPDASGRRAPSRYSGSRVPYRKMTRDGVYDRVNRRHLDVQFGGPCMKLYERRLFDGLRFEPGKIYEDALICHKIYDQVEDICRIDLPLYHYVQTRNSTIRKNGMTASHPDLIEALTARLEYFQSYGNQRFIRKTAYRITDMTIGLWEYLGADGEEIKAVLGETVDRMEAVTGRRYFSARCRLYLLSPALYRLIKCCYQTFRTCIHRRGMPDGRGILLPCKAKNRRNT